VILARREGRGLAIVWNVVTGRLPRLKADVARALERLREPGEA
jgi:uncharacterized protein with HEPN domain